MTHIVHPFAHRLGTTFDWRSRWFQKNPAAFRENMRVDVTIRAFLKKRLRGMYVGSLELERRQKTVRVIIKTSRPGLVIGRGGEGSVTLTKELQKKLNVLKLAEPLQVRVDIEEIRTPESNSAIVAYMVAEQLEKRMTFRRVLKGMVEKVMAIRDVQGVRIAISGRLGGAEMSRLEEIKRGRVPLQTIRADIDYAREEALLPYGIIGVKVWIYKGDIFNREKKVTAKAPVTR
jgi:small subunit ribosomal protein S3